MTLSLSQVVKASAYFVLPVCAFVSAVLSVPGLGAEEAISEGSSRVALLRGLSLAAIVVSGQIFLVRSYRASKSTGVPRKILRWYELAGAVLVFLISLTAFCSSINYEPSSNLRWTYVCERHMFRISRAFYDYYKERGSFPPAFVVDESGAAVHSWRVLLLPYLGETKLYEKYDFSEPWNGPRNSLLASRIPECYKCPLDNGKCASVYEMVFNYRYHDLQANYLLISGSTSAFRDGIAPTLAEFPDGARRTLLLVESSAKGRNWMEPVDTTIAEFSNARYERKRLHSGEFHICFVSGEIKALAGTTTSVERLELADPGDGKP